MTPSFRTPPPHDARRRLAVRWASLARAVGLAPDAAVVVALSGGADSVLLLHLVASAAAEAQARSTRRARTPSVTAVHVEHGLRGAEGLADAEFCEELCRDLGVPLVRRPIELDPDAPSLEARARALRYRVLCEEAAARGAAVILTGHHADDALETLLQRWLRGTELSGLAGLRPRLSLPGEGAAPPRRAARERLNLSGADVDVVRPLIAMRREEVRRCLRDLGIAWREDGSNASPRFTRNRVRNHLLPEIESLCGSDAIANLRAFGAAVETLEEHCAARTAELHWLPPRHAAACRGAGETELGGTLERARLSALVSPLRRRALWRLLTEGTAHGPSRALLDRVCLDLEEGRCARHSLPGGWSLHLRSDFVHLEPPAERLSSGGTAARALDDGDAADGGRGASQLSLPFLVPAKAGAPRDAALELAVPGRVVLADGRHLSAEISEVARGSDVLRTELAVEIDAFDLVLPLAVRFARPGDRFHGLGAPGSRPLARFLADAGVPRRDRGRVPLVFSGDELVWVAGIRPGERRRIDARTEVRLRLELHHPTPPFACSAGREAESGPLFAES